MNHNIRHCPVCGSDRTVPLYLNTLAALDGLDMSYRVARCAACGFAFADQLPSPQTYAAYYRSLSKYDITPSAAGLSAADRLRCDAAVALLRPHAGPDARIVDLGCGSGMLLGALRAAGWSRVSGIDPAPGAPEQARQQFKLDCVQCGTLDQVAGLLDLSAMDVICLTGVLEHLPQVREDLEALAAATGHDVRVLVEVPALERFGRLPFEPYGEFSLEHIQYFSASSLTGLFATLGFTALSSTIVDLPPGYCDSRFALFARNPAAEMFSTSTGATDELERYIARSEGMTQAAIARIAACPAKSLVIYGAGSHTARLLPRLLKAGESRLAGLVDSNPNLRGKHLGPWLIEAPEALDRHPDATIVVSSFRTQQAISDVLRTSRPNSVLTLY
ncbi:MAG: class I SAM-dependent methyltransferase [Sulfuritalea sp.]|jgi:SAM-dependent methyltransferase|nr:class I SAM-dependent methyltransferase [Sulfuritalea sp.]